MTSLPSFKSRSQRWDPMKPAPPVIKILLLMMRYSGVCSFYTQQKEVTADIIYRKRTADCSSITWIMVSISGII